MVTIILVTLTTIIIIIAKELAAGRLVGSNPGLWIPEEDTLPTVYMTIRRLAMMITTNMMFVKTVDLITSLEFRPGG